MIWLGWSLWSEHRRNATTAAVGNAPHVAA